MAVIAPAITELPGDDAVRVVWASMANGDVGGPVERLRFPDRSVQVVGTFGAGGNCRIQGSNEASPTNYATLTDPQGNALDFTAAAIELVTEMTSSIRPNVTAGDGTTNLTVTMIARRNL